MHFKSGQIGCQNDKLQIVENLLKGESTTLHGRYRTAIFSRNTIF